MNGTAKQRQGQPVRHAAAAQRPAHADGRSAAAQRHARTADRFVHRQQPCTRGDAEAPGQHDRELAASPQDLQGRTLTGNVAIFVTPATSVKSVAVLAGQDQPHGCAALHGHRGAVRLQRDRQQRQAVLFNVGTLTAGTHRIAARVTYTNGTTAVHLQHLHEVGTVEVASGPLIGQLGTPERYVRFWGCPIHRKCRATSHELRDIIQFVDRAPTPSLLPIFRSQQQAELLALILGDPSTEHSLVELAERTGIPYASVHREVERAEAAGLVTSRLVGRTRLIRADVASPYFEGLSDVLVKAFGVPWVLGQALTGVGGHRRGIRLRVVGGAVLRRGGRPTGRRHRPPRARRTDRDEVYAAASSAERTARASGPSDHPIGRLADRGQRHVPRHRRRTTDGAGAAGDYTNSSGGSATNSRPTASTTVRAVDSAQAESSALISALDGSKYCAA